MQKFTNFKYALIVLAVFLFSFVYNLSFVKAIDTNLLSPSASDDRTLTSDKNISSVHNQLDSKVVTLPSEINILLLGVDGRKGDSHPRCDTIQFITYNSQKESLTILSVPRGTEIPVKGYEFSSTILSNICHYEGTDYAVKQVKSITGKQPDYVVKLGFSQVLGILRYLNLPTTVTLKFLRNRTLPNGDYQRMHNQALFLKDMVVRHIEEVNGLPKPFKYLLYKTLETDMLFETADAILGQLVSGRINKNSDNIIILTKDSSFRLKEMHLPLNNADAASDKEIENYQSDLENYLRQLVGKLDTLLGNGNTVLVSRYVTTPFRQKLWLQLEDRSVRNLYHFELLRLYVQSSNDENISSLILDYNNEMDIFREMEWKKKGEELLETEINTYNIRARYDDYKQRFYKKATDEYTRKWMENTKKLSTQIEKFL